MSLRRLNDSFKYTNLSTYNQQVTLLVPSDVDNADGSSGDPTVFAVVWAAVRLMRSQEINTSELVQSAVYYDVRIPYMPGVSSQMTVLSPSGQTWFVESVADIDMRQTELKLICRCINDGGVTTQVTEFVQGGTF